MRFMMKRVRTATFVDAAITIVLALCFLLIPVEIASTLAIISGILLLCSAVSDAFRYFSGGDYAIYLRGTLYSAIIKAVLAIFLFTHTDTVVNLIGSIFSIIVILNGIGSLQEAMELRRIRLSGWFIHCLLSILIIFGGIVLLLTPFGGISTMLAITGWLLLLDGVSELVLAFRLKNISNQLAQTAEEIHRAISQSIMYQ